MTRPRAARTAAFALLLLPAALAGCFGGEDEEENVVRGLAHTFDEARLVVAVGTTVTFRMVEGSHTVDFAEGQAAVAGVSAAHSGHLDPGDGFQVTFSAPGTYPYFCQYHSSLSGGERTGMVGVIEVTA